MKPESIIKNFKSLLEEDTTSYDRFSQQLSDRIYDTLHEKRRKKRLPLTNVETLDGVRLGTDRFLKDFITSKII